MDGNGKPGAIIVGPTPPPTHGLTIATERLLNSALRDRFELTHLDTSDRRDIGNMGRFDLINICLAVKSILGMAVYCLSKNPAIVYIPISQSNAGYLRDGLLIAVGKLLSNARIVIHLHGGYFRTFYDQTNFLMKRFIDLTMKSCDRVIVLGNCLKWIFDKWFDEQCIDVVPTGTAMRPKLDSKFSIQKDRYVITYLSNLLKTKGIVDTIESVKHVTSKHENVKYKIAGSWSNKEPETKSECMRLLKANGIEDVVDILGVVTGDDKADLLIDTDIFVFPTYYPFEGHPAAIVEAMSAGCPVISTKHAAIPETVIDGETGILVEKQNPQALADAIARLMENPELRVKMGRAGHERYRRLYTQEKNIGNMTRVFERALAR